jgi:hypothetical protein
MPILRSIAIASPVCCAEPRCAVSTHPDVVMLLTYNGTPPEYAVTPVTPLEGVSAVEHPLMVELSVLPSLASVGLLNASVAEPEPSDPPNNAMTAADPRVVPVIVHVGLRVAVVVAWVNAPAPSVCVTLDMELPVKNPETLGAAGYDAPHEIARSPTLGVCEPGRTESPVLPAPVAEPCSAPVLLKDMAKMLVKPAPLAVTVCDALTAGAGA